MNLINPTNELKYGVGIGGNLYIWSLDKNKIAEMCDIIEKSKASIYFSKKFECYVIRIKSKKHKLNFYGQPRKCSIDGLVLAQNLELP